MSTSSANDFDLINKIQDTSVLVVGDMMLDRFIYGTVERISPESPVPVLSVKRENTMLGGAGNTLSNIITLGAKGKILSVIGMDQDGEKIKTVAAQNNIDTSGLFQSSDRPTIVKTRFLAGHQQLLRTDNERIEDLSSVMTETLIEKAKGLMDDVQIVILSDYGKGILTPHLIQSLITLAKEKNIPVLVDPKGNDYSIYKGADVVTPNKKELSGATAGMAVQSDEEVIEAAQTLIRSSGIKAVVATRSQDGMSIIQKDTAPVHIRSAADIEVFDVSGAGDTVIATLATCLATGGDLVQAASLANIAGSIVVAKVGTAPIRKDELLNFVKGHDPKGDIVSTDNAKAPRFDRIREAPLLSWEEAKEQIQRWKARGLNVGFTNGCFDIVHFGHVTYLNDARKKCDRLIVGLNSDSSVRVLKGPERPVHDENSRAAVLAALGSVDMVIHFGAKKEGDDNTACALLDMIQPDLYFKGGDYTIDQIPEAPTVMRNGGEVDVMPVYEGHSTTNSIKKMRDEKAA
ncbi:MAG: D-glycero-beta-D-manno-heptose-7-phosphate kinase [Alphaproteobacteria bacterium]